MEEKKKKYEPPLAYDLTYAVSDEVRAQSCKSGGTPTAATCKSGNLATAKCSTGIVSGAQCRSGGTAVYTCKSGSVPDSGI
ncbi:MAG: hypothetical protein WBD00_03170 [Candidatus Omnitrophota bacterium]